MTDNAAVSQKNEEFVEPTRDEIVKITRDHVAAMEATDSDEAWVLAGMHHVVLYTVGRKSGTTHSVALPFWRDPDGHRVVVASFAGAPQHPAWYLNLSDRTANPTIRVRVQHGEFVATPQILTGEDYIATWQGLTADRDYYNDYQRRCDRQIPLVRLVDPSADAGGKSAT